MKMMELKAKTSKATRQMMVMMRTRKMSLLPRIIRLMTAKLLIRMKLALNKKT